ncbi:MAG: hypothetical protein EOP54_27530, partial [Sphingobacteriales bacterium]
LGGVYWLLSLAVGIIAVVLSPVIARYWVTPVNYSVTTITWAFFLLGLSSLFQLPTGFYSGGLLGLQRQVVLNLLRMFFATLKNGGALLLLIFVSRDIILFFGWMLFVSILQAFTFKYILWYYLPKTSERTFFDKQEISNIWRFAAGMTAIGLTSILLTQVDKIILSKILSLEQFGYYTFAFTVGSISYMIVGPITQSYFPKFSTLVAQHKTEELKTVYHEGCRLVTLLVIPFAMLLALFSHEILSVWTSNALTVEHSWKIVSVVATAVAVHSLMFMPYMLSLAFGNTKLAFYTNIVILIILIPGTILSAMHYGAIGGAICFLLINIIYFFVNPVLIHRLFLKGETFYWYWNDTISPVIICSVVMLAARFFFWNHHFGKFATIIALASIGISGFAATLLSSKALRLGSINKINLF